MRHALAVIIVAGIGSAAWYRSDWTPRQNVTKIEIPDPGPPPEEHDDWDPISLDLAPEWTPTDEPPLDAVEFTPDDPIAEAPGAIRAVSDEQPFAVSDAEEEESLSPASAAHAELAVNPAPEASAPETGLTSAEGRPISVRRIGQGRFRTVVITGIDGRDRTAVQWSDDLADALEHRADLLQDHEFVLIRAANPDGLAARIRENARGVVLNRNFPTPRYRRDTSRMMGDGPASEPETRALLQVLYEVRPDRIVHLFSTTGPAAVYVNASADEVAERIRSQHGLDPEPLDFDKVPGSVEEFADATWRAGVVRFHLQSLPDGDVSRKLIPLLVTAVSSKAAPTKETTTASPVAKPSREPARWQIGPLSSPVPPPVHQTNRRTRPVIRRGYEELPPPPQ
jgi:hypothetical protein